MRLHLSSGVLQGDGIYVSSFLTAEPPASLTGDSKEAPATALQFVPFGATQFEVRAHDMSRDTASICVNRVSSATTEFHILSGEEKLFFLATRKEKNLFLCCGYRKTW